MTDEADAAALKTQLRNIGRERQALAAEEGALLAEIAAAKLSEADRAVIKEAAAKISKRLNNPTFEQLRALFDLLDVQVELA